MVQLRNIIKENLDTWFKQKWVNIGKKVGGKHPPCGTSGKKSGYAKCVPAAKAAGMSKKEKESATRRKRAAQNDAGRGGSNSGGQGKTPIYVSTKKNEEWSDKYKSSIDCNNPKGFSQKAHCAGKNENKSNNMDEAIHPEVYREFMQACNDAGLNSFEIFGLHVLAYILTLGATGVTILSALGIAQLAKDAKDTFNNWNAGRKLNPEKVKAIVKDFENKVNKLEGGRKKFFQGIINKMKKTNPENKSALVSINKDLDYYAKVYGIKNKNENNMKLTVEQKMELFLEKNVPTDPAKWAASKAAAKSKFDVYPSAYANGWAAKNYKAKGGGWKTGK